MELPKYDSEGAPAGVNEAADEGGGGGPAGVVDGCPSMKRLLGVAGALLSGLLSGTRNRCDMAAVLLLRCVAQRGNAIEQQSRVVKGAEIFVIEYKARARKR